MEEYWDICSDYIFFHFTYSSGSPNVLRDIILNNVTGNPSIFDIVEPHKSRQGSITMVQKKWIVIKFRRAILEINSVKPKIAQTIEK